LKIESWFGDKRVGVGDRRKRRERNFGGQCGNDILDFFRRPGSSDSVGHSAYLTGKVPGG
jgi:hypothetical protein